MAHCRECKMVVELFTGLPDGWSIKKRKQRNEKARKIQPINKESTIR